VKNNWQIKFLHLIVFISFYGVSAFSYIFDKLTVWILVRSPCYTECDSKTCHFASGKCTVDTRVPIGQVAVILDISDLVHGLVLLFGEDQDCGLSFALRKAEDILFSGDSGLLHGLC